MQTLRLCHLYPQEMNTYADRGNVAVFNYRLKWRGLGLEVLELGLGDKLTAQMTRAIDFFYLGGGQDADQELVAHDLIQTKAQAIKEKCEGTTPALFVCGGYQLAGQSYQTPNENLPGMQILAIRTIAGKDRLIGNIRINAQIEKTQLDILGYENHLGRTYLLDDNDSLPKTHALGKVMKGNGNNEKDKTEGAISKRVIGTYMHGPLLPKNPELADLLISWGLQSRYGEPPQLAPLDDTFAERARHP